MNMEIAIVKTFCDFGHKFSKKQQFWWFFMRNLAIKLQKKSGNLATVHSGTSATSGASIFTRDLVFLHFIW